MRKLPSFKGERRLVFIFLTSDMAKPACIATWNGNTHMLSTESVVCDRKLICDDSSEMRKTYLFHFCSLVFTRQFC